MKRRTTETTEQTGEREINRGFRLPSKILPGGTKRQRAKKKKKGGKKRRKAERQHNSNVANGQPQI